VTDTTARVLVRKMLADAANDVAEAMSYSGPTIGLQIKRERVKTLQEISDAFDSPTPATVGGSTYGEVITNIFRANDVREGSSFTHGACVGMMEAAIEAAELTFNADLDKWVKIIGAGVTGYQPEAYAVIDAAMNELVQKRAQLAAIRELLP
jgi:hypothetical protein